MADKFKATAHVSHQSTRPVDNDCFTTVAIEGDNEFDVARQVAEIAARRLYGETGSAGFLMRRRTPQGFIAAIGEYHRGVLEGVTIEIKLNPEDAP